MQYNNSLPKSRKEPFLSKKCKFWKTWLSKLGWHGNANVDEHFTTTLKKKMFPDKFQEKSVTALKVLKWFNLKFWGPRVNVVWVCLYTQAVGYFSVRT